MVAALLVSCGTTSTVPITGRQQTLMVSDGEVLSLATQQYQEFMSKAKLSTNTTNTAMVKRVGQKLATAVNNYLTQNGLASEVQNYKWTFNLVQGCPLHRMRLRWPLSWGMRLPMLWQSILPSR